MSSSKIAAPADIKVFAFAGRARITLVSQKTGVRFTFRVAQGKGENAPFFVSLLTGPNNNSDYEFIGTVFNCTTFVPGRRSRISPDAPSVRAFAWAFKFVAKGEAAPHLDVYHEGCCGRCGRALTTPESVTLGIGPECASKMGLA